jgi:hypothetical protein
VITALTMASSSKRSASEDSAALNVSEIELRDLEMFPRIPVRRVIEN